MAIEWSGLGPDLLVQLDRDSNQPLRSQLEARLRDAIRTGRLLGGERLPSSRELARALAVSRGLVQECYGQLLSEGYLTSQAGSATRVASGRYPSPPAQPQRSERPPRLVADFRSGVPDLASFPRGDWIWATREALGRMASSELDYGDPRGSATLRAVIAGYLRRVRAAAADPDHLIVSTGFAQGLNLVLRALVQAASGASRSKTPATEPPKRARPSGPPERSACAPSMCPWTDSALTLPRSRQAAPGLPSSPRRTSPPPA